MREIKFRGKRLDDGEWVKGYLVKYGFTGKEKYYIVPSYASDLYAMEVDAETVGEYTGLKDKNGKEIYEGDIWKSSENGVECIGVVEYHDCAFKVKYSHTSELLGFAVRYGEVIGNIYSNPELLEDNP
mgnify:CR=1 FL=1